MVYSLIPAASDLISNSQSGLLENFTQLNTQFSVDHDGLITPADGYHKTIHFVTAGSEVTSTKGQLYTFTGTGPNGVATEQLKYAPSTGASDNPPVNLSVLPIRAACVVTGGASAFTGGFNVSGVVRNAAGAYTITYTAQPSSMILYPMITLLAPTPGAVGWVSWVTSAGTTTCTVFVQRFTGGAFIQTDPTKIYFTLLGG